MMLKVKFKFCFHNNTKLKRFHARRHAPLQTIVHLVPYSYKQKARL